MKAGSSHGKMLLVAALLILSILTLLPFYMTALLSQKTNGEILNRFAP